MSFDPGADDCVGLLPDSFVFVSGLGGIILISSWSSSFLVLNVDFTAAEIRAFLSKSVIFCVPVSVSVWIAALNSGLVFGLVSG